MAYQISDLKGFSQWKFALMKNGMCSGRFFGFAFGTTAGMGPFSFAKIGMSAFSADKPIFPFLFCQISHTLLIGIEMLLKINNTDIF